MLLERTIAQLDTGPMPPEEARQMGQLGYMQWLAWLPRDADYMKSAACALDAARPFVMHSPAVAAFCDLLQSSIDKPLRPLDLSMPSGRRRGGAKARRSFRLPI